MTDTARFGLTLLAAAQAQKHVTVNEALVRLDALAAARVEGLGAAIPPADPAEGEVWGVGAGASGAWAGQEGRLAVALSGGWVFDTPPEGWQVWNAATGSRWTRLGAVWTEREDPEVMAVSPGGALTLSRIAEIEHTLAPGATNATAAVIPDKAIVLGVTARVTAAITGATGWSLGVADAPTRYGSGFGTAAGSLAEGVTGQPQAYYGGTPLLLTAEGGDFSAGAIRLAVHHLSVAAPD